MRSARGSGNRASKASELEEYPLAKRYRWRAPRDQKERSLEWHLKNDEGKATRFREFRVRWGMKLYYEWRGRHERRSKKRV